MSNEERKIKGFVGISTLAMQLFPDAGSAHNARRMMWRTIGKTPGLQDRLTQSGYVHGVSHAFSPRAVQLILEALGSI